MKVFLSATFAQRAKMRKVRSVLNGMGIEVTSTWMDVPEGVTDDTVSFKVLRKAAKAALREIDESDVVVFFSSPVSAGKNVEFGYCLAKDKTLVVVGEPNCVFHWGVIRVSCVEDLYKCLGSFAKRLSYANLAKEIAKLKNLRVEASRARDELGSEIERVQRMREEHSILCRKLTDHALKHGSNNGHLKSS